MLAELLADRGRLDAGVTGDVLDEARALLEAAARDAAALGGWTPDDPLRLSKGPVTWLLRCPRRAAADDDGWSGDPSRLVVGLLVDAGAKLATLGPTIPVTVERALEYVVASGDGARLIEIFAADEADAAAAPVPELPRELLDDAAARLEPLVGAWPAIDPEWWPRVEEPARVRLADGAVTFGGKLDILLGGPPTALPGLVVEIKSGAWHDAVRSDSHLYGLLVGLRDGCAPAAVLTIAAGDGATQLEPIRPAVLLHAAERVAVALDVAARLAAGEAPAAQPGSHCGHCPVLADCTEGRRFVAIRDTDAGGAGPASASDDEDDDAADVDQDDGGAGLVPSLANGER